MTGDRIIEGEPEILENGEPPPPPMPPAGMPVPGDVRVYALRLRDRAAIDPYSVPGPLLAWLYEYTIKHTDANRPASSRRAAFFEESIGGEPPRDPETEKARGERLDKVIKAQGQLDEVQLKRDEALFKQWTAAFTAGTKHAETIVKSQSEAQTALAGLVGALAGVLTASATNDKEKLADHLALIGILKKANNGEPIQGGINWKPVIDTIVPLAQTVGIPLLMKFLKDNGLQLTEKGVEPLPSSITQIPQAAPERPARRLAAGGPEAKALPPPRRSREEPK